LELIIIVVCDTHTQKILLDEATVRLGPLAVGSKELKFGFAEEQQN
jgi:hypothetical protein